MLHDHGHGRSSAASCGRIFCGTLQLKVEHHRQRHIKLAGAYSSEHYTFANYDLTPGLSWPEHTSTLWLPRYESVEQLGERMEELLRDTGFSMA